MAKKSSEPTYAEAALAISKEEFKALLEIQMDKGEQLLSVNVPVINRVPRGYGGFLGGGRLDDKVVYDKAMETQFIDDYKRWHNYNVEIYKSSFTAPNNTYRHDYESQIYTIWGSDMIKEYKDNIRRLINQMKGDVEKLHLIKCAIESQEPLADSIKFADSKKVFIVHGHDEHIRVEVEAFLRCVGYEPIVLFKEPNNGQTIIEKIEANAKDVCYAIVLYTPCDIGRDKNASEDKPRARQNVVFEHGYMCAKLGRQRVCALCLDGVEIPGDLSGIVYTPCDPSGAWKYAIARDMKAIGLSVDMNTIK